MKKCPLKVGDWVQSFYAAPWKGVVIGYRLYPAHKLGSKYFPDHWVIDVVPVLSRTGTRIKKRNVHTLDVHYLKLVDVPDIEVNPDWFKR